jgi:hypothetical protein
MDLLWCVRQQAGIPIVKKASIPIGTDAFFDQIGLSDPRINLIAIR